MEELLRKQQEGADKINLVHRNYNKDSDIRKTKTYLESRIQSLKLLYKDYVATDDQIRSAIPPLESTHPYWGSRKQLVERYELLLEDMRQRLNKGPPSTPTIPTPDGSQPSSLASNDFDISKPNEMNSKSGEQQHSSIPQIREPTDNGDINDKLFKKQDILMRQLYKNIASIEYSLDTTECSKEYVQLKTNQLQKHMDVIDQLHTEIMVESDESERITSYFKKDFHGTLQAKVEATIIRLQQLQRETPTTKGSPKIKLPILEVPNFAGDYENWSSFNDIFTEIIHRNNSISDTVKMSYLKSHLHKSAAQLISHLSTTGENYEMAWNLLQSRYNNPRLLAAKHFNSLLAIPTIQVATAGALRNLHDSAKEMLHNIERLKLSSPFESFVTFILIKKMDSESARLYESTVSNPREVPKLSEYFDFMERRDQP